MYISTLYSFDITARQYIHCFEMTPESEKQWHNNKKSTRIKSWLEYWL